MIMLCSMFLMIGIGAVGSIYSSRNGDMARYSLFMLFFAIFVVYSIITCIIFYGKTVELGPDGCTITFLGLKKFYPWAHYETKVYQVNKGRKDTIISVHAHIIFLPRFFWRVPSAMLLCQMLYPLSGICLNYQSETVPQIFPITREALDRLSQWNVQIRNLPRTIDHLP